MEVESTLFEVILILLLILVNGFFVAAEFAIVRIRSAELEPYIEKGNHRAKTAKNIVDNLNQYISATQLGITIVNIILGIFGEGLFARIFVPVFDMFSVKPNISHPLSLVLGILSITFVTVSIGELTPKQVAVRFPLKIALWFSFPLNLFYKIFKPFIQLLQGTAALVLKIFGIKPVTKEELYHNEEEIRAIIAEGKKSGVIDTTEHQLIEKIFEFNDKIAREIMVPRNHMIALNINDSREKIYQTVVEEGYSRLPVYKDTIDNIVGVIYTKDLISASEHRELITLTDIIRPPTFVTATMQIGDMLKELQKKKVHLAIVVDEYGGVEGLVTMEDILEEIVGEIQDEYDIEPQEIVREKSGIYLVNPMIDIDEFNAKLKVNLPEDPDYQTLSGFLQKTSGHIPEQYERIEYQGMSFVVTKKDGNRIQQVRFQKI
ncbi:MAG: hemolysin family protein [Ignavibacteria bacterium]